MSDMELGFVIGIRPYVLVGVLLGKLGQEGDSWMTIEMSPTSDYKVKMGKKVG